MSVQISHVSATGRLKPYGSGLENTKMRALKIVAAVLALTYPAFAAAQEAALAGAVTGAFTGTVIGGPLGGMIGAAAALSAFRQPSPWPSRRDCPVRPISASQPCSR